MVGEVEYQYNDETYYRGEGTGVKPVILYTTKEKAEFEALRMTRVALCGSDTKETYYWPNLMEFGYGLDEVFEDEETATDLLKQYGMPSENLEEDRWDLDLRPYLKKMSQADFKQFVGALGVSFYEVVEVNYSTDETIPVEEPTQYQFVFTGFRDSVLETAIIKAGHLIGSSVSKKTTHVVAEDPTDLSAKIVKAKETGIPVITETQLKKLLKLR